MFPTYNVIMKKKYVIMVDVGNGAKPLTSRGTELNWEHRGDAEVVAADLMVAFLRRVGADYDCYTSFADQVEPWPENVEAHVVKVEPRIVSRLRTLASYGE